VRGDSEGLAADFHLFYLNPQACLDEAVGLLKPANSKARKVATYLNL
jgi:hypothetical protein